MYGPSPPPHIEKNWGFRGRDTELIKEDFRLIIIFCHHGKWNSIVTKRTVFLYHNSVH